jgi:hypothetical protein
MIPPNVFYIFIIDDVLAVSFYSNMHADRNNPRPEGFQSTTKESVTQVSSHASGDQRT